MLGGPLTERELRERHRRRRRMVRAGRRNGSWVLLVAVALAVTGWWLTDQHEATRDTGIAATLPPTLPPDSDHDRPDVASLWIGDSYTAGTGAKAPDQAESALTAQKLGWLFFPEAQGSTGFVADGHLVSTNYSPIPARLPGILRKYAPNVVVIDAGRNDTSAPLADVEDAAAGVFADVHAKWPRAQIVTIAPYFIDSADRPLGEEFLAFLRDQMSKVDGHLVDPIGEGWVGAKTAPYAVSQDDYHPSPEGHRYIAAHLAADLQRLRLG